MRSLAWWLLGTLPNMPYQTGERVTYLFKKLEGSQKKIHQFDGEMLEMKEILGSESVGEQGFPDGCRIRVFGGG